MNETTTYNAKIKISRLTREDIDVTKNPNDTYTEKTTTYKKLSYIILSADSIEELKEQINNWIEKDKQVYHNNISHEIVRTYKTVNTEIEM